jgi:hypothetical protein
MLNRILDEFNYDHRSHVYNTGTVSVVVNKPHHEHKILNANYHANLVGDKNFKKDVIETLDDEEDSPSMPAE